MSSFACSWPRQASVKLTLTAAWFSKKKFPQLNDCVFGVCHLAADMVSGHMPAKHTPHALSHPPSPPPPSMQMRWRD